MTKTLSESTCNHAADTFGRIRDGAIALSDGSPLGPEFPGTSKDLTYSERIGDVVVGAALYDRRCGAVSWIVNGTVSGPPAALLAIQRALGGQAVQPRPIAPATRTEPPRDPATPDTTEEDQVTALRRRFESLRLAGTVPDAGVTIRGALVAMGHSQETADRLAQRWDAAADVSSISPRLAHCRSLAQTILAKFSRPSRFAESDKPIRCELRFSSKTSARGEAEVDALVDALVRVGMTFDEACEVKHLVKRAGEIEEEGVDV